MDTCLRLQVGLGGPGLLQVEKGQGCLRAGGNPLFPGPLPSLPSCSPPHPAPCHCRLAFKPRGAIITSLLSLYFRPVPEPGSTEIDG